MVLIQQNILNFLRISYWIENLFPYLKPSPQKSVYYPVLNGVRAIDSLLKIWFNYKVEGTEKLADFMQEHPIQEYSYWGLSNHIGEIETFWVPMTLIRETTKAYGLNTAFENTYHIIAKEELFGEKDYRHMNKEGLQNQKMSLFGRIIYACGTLKFFRLYKIPEQLDTLVDEVVDKKKNLVIFPQGHRMKEDAVIKAGPVLAYMGIYSKAQVAIVPVYLKRNFDVLDWRILLPKAKKMRIEIKEPYLLDKEELKSNVFDKASLEELVSGKELFRKHRKILQEESKNFIERIVK